jgi:hypothetical protein
MMKRNGTTMTNTSLFCSAISALALLMLASGCGEAWDFGLSGTAKLNTGSGQRELKVHDGDEDTNELSIRRHMTLTFTDAANTYAHKDPLAPFDRLELEVVLGHPIGGVGSNTLESVSVSRSLPGQGGLPLTSWTVEMHHFDTHTFTDDIPESIGKSVTHWEHASGEFAFTLTGPGGSPRYVIHDGRFKALTQSKNCIEATGGCSF